MPQLRKHLDNSFDSKGQLKPGRGRSVGGIIAAFQARTGSGGIVGTPLAAHTVVTSATPQQSATAEKLPSAQTAQTLSADNKGSQLKEAAAEVTSSLSSLLSAATPSTSSPLSNNSSSLPQAAAEVTQALGSVVNRLTLLQASDNMNSAIRSAEDSSSKSLGLQLMQAAGEVTKQLSATLNKATE